MNIETTRLKSFQYWKTQEIEKYFNLKLIDHSPMLEEWLTATCEITEFEQRQLTSLQQRLREKAAFWNEAALKFFFIGPLINLVDYNTKQYNGFLEHPMKIKYGEQEINGNVGFLVATGKQIPETPFFTLHEYKPEPGYMLDPLGQLLIAMIAAQQANEQEDIQIPLYGTYVIGRLWFFILLNGKEYAVSLAYDATREDLQQIFCILKQVKIYIEEQLATTVDF